MNFFQNVPVFLPLQSPLRSARTAQTDTCANHRIRWSASHLARPARTKRHYLQVHRLLEGAAQQSNENLDHHTAINAIEQQLDNGQPSAKRFRWQFEHWCQVLLSTEERCETQVPTIARLQQQ